MTQQTTLLQGGPSGEFKEGYNLKRLPGSEYGGEGELNIKRKKKQRSRYRKSS